MIEQVEAWVCTARMPSLEAKDQVEEFFLNRRQIFPIFTAWDLRNHKKKSGPSWKLYTLCGV